MCILAIIVMEGYMLTVYCTKMDKFRPWKPKDGDNCIGGNGLRLNTAVLPLVLFSDCKTKRRLLPEQSKVAIWKNGGNLELEINLNAASSSAGSGGEKTCEAVLNADHTLSSFTTQSKLSQYVYKKQYYPETLSICTNGWAHTFSLLHANDVSSENLQRLYSCPFHVWDIGFCTWPSCIPLPGCFSMDACTAICLQSCYQAAWREIKCHLKWGGKHHRLSLFLYFI